ncbi:MAG: fatty acid desaturase, partial [bacterium]
MKAKEILTERELQQITSRNNWLGASIVLFDWVVIIGTFVLVSMYTNPLTILLGVFVLGARQLGLGVIVHETGHRSFFTSQFWNDLVGNWLAGYWI